MVLASFRRLYKDVKWYTNSCSLQRVLGLSTILPCVFNSTINQWLQTAPSSGQSGGCSRTSR